jgi:hypothetical protein
MSMGVVMVARPLTLSPAEVDEFWARWRSGQAVKVWARDNAGQSVQVRDLLHRTGGIRPATKRRWEVGLSLAEREEISRGLAAALSLRMIAAGLGSGAVDGEPGGPQQRRSGAVSGGGRGSGGVEPDGPSEGDQACRLSGALTPDHFQRPSGRSRDHRSCRFCQTPMRWDGNYGIA